MVRDDLSRSQLVFDFVSFSVVCEASESCLTPLLAYLLIEDVFNMLDTVIARGSAVPDTLWRQARSPKGRKRERGPDCQNVRN